MLHLTLVNALFTGRETQVAFVRQRTAERNNTNRRILLQRGQEVPRGSEACSWFLAFTLSSLLRIVQEAVCLKAGRCLLGCAAPKWTIGGQVLQDRENYYADVPSSDSRALDVLHTVQRRRNWCARWGDYCVKDAKVKLAQCCSGLRCMCSKLWKRGCVCRRQPTFG
ncbi:hypothetical protein LSAT2_018172 [Lamellibrachia satsuma]|nr:hypothetical protein LSAT2_018172 [Lamellibrachia satsuma]